jgi:hypothetical protein
METERGIKPRKYIVSKNVVELNPEATMKEQQKKNAINTAKPNDFWVLFWLNLKVKKFLQLKILQENELQII